LKPQSQTAALLSLCLVSVFFLIARLWLDGHLELVFDEAYYALWARNLAWSYFDHPPMVALWIRFSTLCFGDHEFGVRALGTFSASAGTALIYFLSLRLFARREMAIFAALLYCAMLLISAGAIIITPDTPLIFFWSIAVYALVRIFCGGSSRWWLIVGLAMGLALQSKYTALLLGAGIVCAMVVVPRLRLWWRHPMPYISGLLSFGIFAPVILWNYRQGWASFALQFGRAHINDLSIRYIGEFLGSQIGLLTPFVFILALCGLRLGLRRHGDKDDEAHLFLVSLIAPLLAYFLFHSLHGRVHGNWIAPAYPVVAILGAEAAFRQFEFSTRLQGIIAWSRRLAVPVGLAVTAIAYLQAATAFVPMDPSTDPTGLMSGWAHLADQLDAIAEDMDARYIITSHYVLTSELNIYSRAPRPIIQYNERIRWLSFDAPPAEVFGQRGLYVVEAARDLSSELAPRYAEFKRIAAIDRSRDGRAITRYVVYLVAKPTRSILD
jgi:4-amino-4-deoxy-L-arabinose transferase-like glycosyltransferase